MIAFALTFLRANWKLLAALSLALSALLWSRHQGAESIRKEEAKSLARAQVVVAKRVVKAQVITTKVAGKLTADRVQIHQHTQALLARVKTDVPPADDAACHPGPLFVRDFNAAALGSPPELPGPANGPERPAR